MNKLESSQLVAVLFAAYPNASVDRKHADAYVSGIADLDAKAAARAMLNLCRTRKFLPTIAEIREACAEVLHGPARSGEQAYAVLTAALRRFGRDYGQGEPKFRDPLIRRCLGVWGSWNDFCASPTDDPGGRARFVQLYDELARREREAITSANALPKPVRPPAAVEPRRAEPQLAEPAPAAFVQELLAQVTAPPKRADRSPAEPKRWSAAELDAALGDEPKKGAA